LKNRGLCPFLQLDCQKCFFLSVWEWVYISAKNV
jgi:hypothetical protein